MFFVNKNLNFHLVLKSPAKRRSLPFGIEPAFILRLTEEEQARRQEELKSSKAYQQSIFNPEQEHLGGTGESPQFAIKTAEKLRTWYSKWHTPNKL